MQNTENSVDNFEWRQEPSDPVENKEAKMEMGRAKGKADVAQVRREGIKKS